MTIEFWLAISAGATFLLALAAFLAIRQTRDVQKGEKRERQLREIIVWAEDIFKCGRVPDIVYLKRLELTTEAPKARESAIADDARYRFNGMQVRSVYIRKITLNFSEDLQRAVNQTIIRLDQQVRVLQLVSDGKARNRAAGIHRRILDECAKTVIVEAANLL